MTKQTLQFKSVVKDRLFYNQYEYCFSFALAEAHSLRGLKHEEIDYGLDQRIEWREIARRRWQSTVNNYGWKEITSQMREDLHQVCDTILNAKVECKLVVSTHFGWIYTNDIGFIKQLTKFKCLTNKLYTQAVINRPKNTILLKCSKYQNRSYFCNLKLTDVEKDTLKNFFTNQRDHIRTSPSLHTWLYDRPYKRTQDYYFIDYTGEQWLTMLGLIRPGLIRKTQTIINK